MLWIKPVSPILFFSLLTFSVAKEHMLAYPCLYVPHSKGTIPGAWQGYRISQPQTLKSENEAQTKCYNVWRVVSGLHGINTLTHHPQLAQSSDQSIEKMLPM